MAPRRASAASAWPLTPMQSSRCSFNTPQARSATSAGFAFGLRTSAAAIAASCASRPLGCLANNVCASASMPTTSPRKGTLLR